MKKILPLLMAIIAYSSDLDLEVSKLLEKAANEKVDANITISKEALDAAKNAMKDYEEKQKPEIEKWKESMSYEDGKIVFDRKQKKDDNDNNKSLLSSDERIYIFMSSSIPRETWLEYTKTIDAMGLGNQAIMIIRGCIGGCEKIKPTLNFINDIITDKGTYKDGMKAQVWIDPLLFRKYNITKVPVFVYAKGLQTDKIGLSEGLEANIKHEPITYKSIGDWGFEYHVKELYAQSKSQSLKRLLDKFGKNEFYYGKKR